MRLNAYQKRLISYVIANRPGLRPRLRPSASQQERRAAQQFAEQGAADWLDQQCPRWREGKKIKAHGRIWMQENDDETDDEK